jgi:transcriptional regulator with XRE-family HTH domain
MAKIILEEVLKKKRVSKREFAKRLGIAYKNVFRLFHDGANPRFSALNKYASVLGVRVRDLIKD